MNGLIPLAVNKEPVFLAIFLYSITPQIFIFPEDTRSNSDKLFVRLCQDER